MANSKKWSEQILVERSFKAQDENGNEVINKLNVLDVCIGGLNLFRKEFVNDKYKGKNKLVVPFDFIVLAGSECPKGKFYELEYFIGEGGMVYRALLQMVNPKKDVRTILAMLKRKNLLPAEFNPRQVWLRDDIDKVMMGYCFKEDDVCFSGGYREAEECDQSINSYINGITKFACLEYYRGECKEYEAKPEDIGNFPKVFVCGSDNVNDPEFAERREADMEEMKEFLAQAIEIMETYNLQHYIAVETIEQDDSHRIITSVNCTKEFMEAVKQGVTVG